MNEKLRPLDKNSGKNFILLISIITFFVFVISFTAFYTKENFSSVCGCKLPIWVIIISISSFGMFAGSLIYYLLNKNLFEEKKDIKNSISKILNFLGEDEKKVLEFIINNFGEVHQSKISKELKINKVRLSRTINRLEKKQIIKKEKKGMTNLIILERGLKEIFE
ncbi:MAG: MarR family transcriptional regulator [archaeon]